MISPLRKRSTLLSNLRGRCDNNNYNDDNNSDNNKKQLQIQQPQYLSKLVVVSHTFFLLLMLLLLFMTVTTGDEILHYHQQQSALTTRSTTIIDNTVLTRFESIDVNKPNSIVNTLSINTTNTTYPTNDNDNNNRSNVDNQLKETAKARITTQEGNSRNSIANEKRQEKMRMTKKKKQKRNFWDYNVSSATAIQDYLDLLQPMGRNRIAIFRWNPDGTLDNNIIFPTVGDDDDKKWWLDSYFSRYDNIQNGFNTTSKSLHGKIAMMYVWDVLIFVLKKPQWVPIMDPPIPMFVYTIPQRLQDQEEVKELSFVRQNDDGTNETISWTTTPHLPDLQNNNPTDRNDINASIITNNIIHIPNPYDYSGFSQRSVDSIIDKNTFLLDVSYEKFHERSNILLWRGSDHNEVLRHQLVALSQNQQDDENSKKIWLDAKFSGWGPKDDNDLGIITQEHMVLQYKYHLDVGGCSGTSWEGIRWKLCTGNVVFVIDTSMVEWWFPYLVPYTHYIPIKEDLSNLYEQYTWVENNPIKAYSIAKAGQELCLETYKSANAIEFAKPIIEQLQDATIQQIEEFDILLLQQQQQQNEKGLGPDNT